MNVKKILTIIGAILAAIVGVVIGRGLPQRRRVPGVRGNLDALGESARRSADYNKNLGEQLEISRISAGEIADRNRDNVADVERAKEILRRAKARSDQVGRSRKSD